MSLWSHRVRHEAVTLMLFNQSKIEPGAWVSPVAIGTCESVLGASRQFSVSLCAVWNFPNSSENSVASRASSRPRLDMSA